MNWRRWMLRQDGVNNGDVYIVAIDTHARQQKSQLKDARWCIWAADSPDSKVGDHTIPNESDARHLGHSACGIELWSLVRLERHDRVFG